MVSVEVSATEFLQVRALSNRSIHLGDTVKKVYCEDGILNQIISLQYEKDLSKDDRLFYPFLGELLLSITIQDHLVEKVCYEPFWY